MPEKILLHTCCAPCSIAIVEELRGQCDLTVFFYNPNVFPEAEYLKRKAEVISYCTDWGVPMVDCDYGFEAWETKVAPVPQEEENGSRCSACYRLRLAAAAEYARNHGFDRFASSLASGRTKKSAVINAIGRTVGREAGLPFLEKDWKKDGRMERGYALVAERGIYRQDYCGCRFSLADRDRRNGRAAGQPDGGPADK